MNEPNSFNPSLTPDSAFYFTVTFDGDESMASSFQEVSGMKMSFTEAGVEEGGENRFSQKLPKPPEYSNLIFKRCLLPNASLEAWCRNAFDNQHFDPKNLRVTLVGGHGRALASWQIISAYPVAWQLAALDTTSSELVIETLELKYRHFKRER